MKIIITNHAKKRGKRRLGLKRDPLRKMAEKAFRNGMKHQDANGRLRKFMDAQYLSYQTANCMRIYNEHLWIFAGHTLVTLVRLPNRFMKLSRNINEKSV